MTETKRDRENTRENNREHNFPRKQIHVGLVDDHPVVREGLRSFLQLAGDVQVVAEAGTLQEALEMARSVQLDVILMDLVLHGTADGITATRIITEEHPEIRILALTSFQDASRMMNVIEAGAVSYLHKDVSPDQLLNAIRQTASGRTVLEPAALQELRKHTHTDSHQGDTRQSNDSRDDLRPSKSPERHGVDPLTIREQQVLDKLAKGCSNKEIGSELGITEKTVKVHISHILGKLGVYDRTQALLRAAKLGMIELDT